MLYNKNLESVIFFIKINWNYLLLLPGAATTTITTTTATADAVTNDYY
jgi:hypothetical protein